jgi:hypothetical protein
MPEAKGKGIEDLDEIELAGRKKEGQEGEPAPESER